MTDITQGQDALPDVDSLFPPRDADELFPAEIERDRARKALGASPMQDFLFSEDGPVGTRISAAKKYLDAFGQGVKHGWGSEPLGLSQASVDHLKKSGVWNDYEKGQFDLVKAANETLMRPAAITFDAAFRTMTAAFTGPQAAIVAVGQENQFPRIARDIAAMPEAFQGSPQPTGTPRQPHIVDRATDLKVVGPGGEAAFHGTFEVPRAEPVLSPDVVREVKAQAAPDMVAAAPEPPRDVHIVAREIAPDVFREYDSLVERRNTFRDWIDELRTRREQEVDANAPHAAEIADLEARLADPDTTPRLRKKYEARLDPLLEDRNAYFDRQTAGDTPDMQRLRDRLQEADYRMRDLAPQVSDAYRKAREQVPEETTGPRDSVPPQAGAEQVGTLNVGARDVTAGETAPPAKVEPALTRDQIYGPNWVGMTVDPARAGEIQGGRISGFDAQHGSVRLTDGTEMQVNLGAGVIWDAKGNEIAPQVVAEFKNPNGEWVPVKREPARAPVEATAPALLEPDKPPNSAQSLTGLDALIAKLDDEKNTSKEYIAGSDISDMYSGAIDSATNVKQPSENDIKYIKWAIDNGRNDIAEAIISRQERNADRLKVAVPGVDKDIAPDRYAAAEARLSELAEKEGALARKMRALLPKASMTNIAEDVTRKLMAAGRPAEEAQAAAQIVKAYWETRAERFKGAKGTAEEMYAREAPEIKAGKGVEPVRELEMAQSQNGRIRLREDGQNTITLMKSADASTFIHETGHDWLARLMKDAEDAAAPADLVADSNTALKWLGVDKAEDIKTKQHEKFARGFETYMMEGRAPSKALAGVFAQFRDWLVKIYETVAKLRAPINDDIRAVFDRFLAKNPERQDAVIVPDREPGKRFADIHEADVETTPPERARPVAETIQAERDKIAADLAPELDNARLEGVARRTGEREQGSPQLDGARDAAGPVPGEAGNRPAVGEVGEGGNAAPQGGAGPRTEAPASPGERFSGSTSPNIDKAGNIRLDTLGTPEDINRAIRDAAEANDEFITARRGVITDGQVLDLADALGMDAGQLSTRKLGEAFNAEQVMAARKLLIRSATEVRDAALKASTGTDADVIAYGEARSRHQMIQEQVAGVTAEAGRALRAFRSLAGQTEAKIVGDVLKKDAGQTLYQLRREADLLSKLEDPAQVSRMTNQLREVTWKDMVIEGWMAFILSGLKTHAANIMGNSLTVIARPLETAVAAGIGKARNLVTGTNDRVFMREAGAELFGMAQGSKEGIVAAYKAFKTEEPQFTGTKQVEQQHARAIPSATVTISGREMEIGGKQVRIGLRALTAEDEFFKGVAFRSSINRQAVHQALIEGLEGERQAARVAELSMNPTSEMIDAAKKFAEYQTFQAPLGPVGRAVQNFANSHILAKLVVPFVRTPVNLLKYAGERTPLGLFSKEVRDNLSGKNGAIARDTQNARIAIGSMIGVAAFEMATQGLITGGGPADREKRSIMQADGWQPYSVRVGDMYYAYNRLDPFSIILGLSADYYEISKSMKADDPKREHLANLIFAAISKNVLERASLKGPSDLIQAVSDPERYGKSYIKGLVGSFAVPAIVAQSAQTIDPVTREARSIIDGIKARTPYLSESLMPKRDVWGEPIMREGGLGPDLASPIVERRMKNDPVNKALLDAGYFPGKVQRKIRNVELTDQQYDDYARVSGRMAKSRLDMVVRMPGFEQMPKGVREDLMRSTVTASRKAAQDFVLMQYPEIITKAMNAKTERLAR